MNEKKSIKKSVKPKQIFKRVNINFPLVVADKITAYAEENGFNFSQSVIVLVQKSLEQNSLLEILPSIAGLIQDEQKKTRKNDTKKS